MHDRTRGLEGLSTANLLADAVRVIAKNQHACWPTRNETGRKRWQFWLRARQEPKRWACVEVNDHTTGEGVRNVFISPDGRIGTGHIYPRAAMMVAYVQEIETPFPEEWRLNETLHKLINGLSGQKQPAIVPAV